MPSGTVRLSDEKNDSPVPAVTVDEYGESTPVSSRPTTQRRISPDDTAEKPAQPTQQPQRWRRNGEFDGTGAAQSPQQPPRNRDRWNRDENAPSAPAQSRPPRNPAGPDDPPRDFSTSNNRAKPVSDEYNEAPSSAAPLQARPRRFFDMQQLDKETLHELRDRAKNMAVQGFSKLKKDDLIVALLRAQAEKQGLEYRGGVLDVIDENVGFLRAEHYLPGPEDIYVSPSQIRRFGLRMGDMVFGQVRAPKDNEKYYSLLRVEAVNGNDPEAGKDRPNFQKLTPIFPQELYDLEQGVTKLSTRLINLIAPIGKGQRGLIVAPPKVGKTTILKDIANAISAHYRDTHLMVALIAERPEEATDMDRSVDGEVISSTFDEPVQNHVRVAEMVLARAKRLVEGGRDVVILLDSLTRLSRAYNLVVPSSGRTLSGGVDPAAMYPPKEFFGAARKIEEGGSLTIIATVLVDTGSRMDDFIFEEFKGTGNQELHLSRRLADRRVFPAIDIERSGTRRDDLLLGEKTVARTYMMRRMWTQLTLPQPQGAGYEIGQAMDAFLSRFNRTKSNEEFLTSLTA